MSHTEHTAVNPYLKTRVMTATPAQLRLMLLDGAIKFAQLGRAGLAEKDYEKSFTNISRTEDIVMELLESLNPDAEPALCDKLKSLYVYLYLELVRAASDKDIARIDEVIRLLRYERETWQLAMDKLAAGDDGDAGPSADSAPIDASAKTNSQAPNGSGSSANHRPISLRG